MHSWGVAIDLNVRENILGASPGRMHPEVVRAFKQYGWIWGGDFTLKNCQHFQLAENC